METTFTYQNFQSPEITRTGFSSQLSLGAVILLHLGLFYVLRTALVIHTPEKPQPKEIFVSLISPSPTIATVPITEKQPQPRAIPHKKTPVAHPTKTISPPKPVAPKPIAQMPNISHAPAPVITPPIPTTSSETAIAAPSAAPPQASNVTNAEKTTSHHDASVEDGEPTPPAQPKVITSGVGYIHKVEPFYPPVSQRLQETGTATIRVLINQSGQPEKAEILKSSGFTRLDDEARKAALKMLYKPYMENGKPIPIRAIIPFTFTPPSDE
ncbi:MAG: TonB family protein [Pseudomonadota bacterium]